MEERDKEGGGYDLWTLIVKPATVILAIVIGVFIVQAVFNFSASFRWGLAGIIGLLWLIYYYVFEFRRNLPKKGEEMPDEV